MSGNRDPGIGNREYEPIDGDAFLGSSEDERRSQIVDHRDLDVWKAAMLLTTEVYTATKQLPANERFGLTSQMRRAAVSIPANIAEGYGRSSSGSYIQFLRISQGSARELETLVEISKQLGYLTASDCVAIDDLLNRVTMMLGRLIRAIELRLAK